MKAPDLFSNALDSLNPGIRRTVTWLRSLGFDTCDSGDGMTHDHPCDRAYPYVVMRLNTDELIATAHDLKGCVSGALGRGPLRGTREGRVVSATEAFASGETPRGVCIQASYDPVEQVALLELIGMCDAMLPDGLGA